MEKNKSNNFADMSNKQIDMLGNTEGGENDG